MDLLSEYIGLTRTPGEFDDFRRSGLLGDVLSGHAGFPDDRQYNFVHRSFTCVSPFYKPTAKQKLKSRLKVGLSLISSKPKFKRAEKFLSCLQKCSLESDPDIAAEYAKEYIHWVSRVLYRGGDVNVFFNPIFLGLHNDIWPKCFHPFKVIFVKRDPADQLAELLNWKMASLEMDTPVKSIHTLYGQGREALAEFHTDVIKSRHEHITRAAQILGNDVVKVIQFEDLIKDYEVTKRSIEDFLQITPSDHRRPMSRLNPKESSKNIGKGRINLTEKEMEMIQRKFEF